MNLVAVVPMLVAAIILISSFSLSNIAAMSTVESQGSPQRAHAAVTLADAQLDATLASAVQAAPTAVLTSSDLQAVPEKGYTVEYVVVGDTARQTGPDVASGVEVSQMVERRVAIDVTLTKAGTTVYTERRLYRLTTAAPYDALVGSQVLGASDDRAGNRFDNVSGTAAAAAGDYAGCSGSTDASGCDAAAIGQQRAADDARAKTMLQCVPGSASGICSPGEEQDISTYANQQWADGQEGQGANGP